MMPESPVATTAPFRRGPLPTTAAATALDRSLGDRSVSYSQAIRCDAAGTSPEPGQPAPVRHTTYV